VGLQRSALTPEAVPSPLRANNFTAFRIFSLEDRYPTRAATSFFLECRNVQLSCLHLVSD
jgi:hypothetical protein